VAAIGTQGSLAPFRNILKNFAARFPEKNSESKPGDVCSNVSDRFFCVLIADFCGFTAAISDQARATIGKTDG
jgi:hypothetical protein